MGVADTWVEVVMKKAISTFKTYFLTSAIAGVVLAGTYADLQLRSTSFMFEEKIDIVSFKPEEADRFVASRVHSFNQPAVKYIGVNEKNKKKINGRWEVTRVLDTKGDPIYDSYSNTEDKKSIIIVDMELISTSTVALDKDPNQVFKISILTNKNTIAMFKVINGGYEILEAKKIIPKPKFKGLAKAKRPELVSPKVSKAVKKENKKGIRIKDVDLLLESALNPLQSRNVLNIKQVSGNLSIFDGSIQDFSASLNIGSAKEVNLDFSFAEIKDGGQFEAEISGELATGILTNNGENSFKVRFATGPLQGAILTFVTQEKYDESQEKFANFEEKKPEVQQEGQLRLEGNKDDVDRVPAEEQSEEEDEVVKFQSNQKKLEYVAEYGFSFGKSERKPASIK